MPEDTELYKGIISRLKPKQAKKLAEEMDSMSTRRALASLITLIILVGMLFFLFLFAH